MSDTPYSRTQSRLRLLVLAIGFGAALMGAAVTLGMARPDESRAAWLLGGAGLLLAAVAAFVLTLMKADIRKLPGQASSEEKERAGRALDRWFWMSGAIAVLNGGLASWRVLKLMSNPAQVHPTWIIHFVGVGAILFGVALTLFGLGYNNRFEATFEDELLRTHRDQAVKFGFIVLLVLASAVFVIGLQNTTLAMAGLPLAISFSLAGACIYLGVLQYRAGRLG